MSHFINIDQSELNLSIYRIFSIKRFEELLITNQTALVRPNLWEDPFENFMLSYSRKKFKEEPNKYLRWYGSDLFGQCWTLNNENDAMWRIYTPLGDGVKVEIKIKDLYDSMTDTFRESVGGRILATCFIGKVIYESDDKIMRMIENKNFQKSNSSSDTAQFRALALLHKRKEFEHEKEVRLIYECWNPAQIINDNYINFELNYNKLFKSIV